MNLETISPDQVVYAKWGVVTINATLVYTWATIAIIAITVHLITRKLIVSGKRTRGQQFLEWAVDAMKSEIGQAMNRDPRPYLPFIAGLFLFIAVANILAVVPGYVSPTASLSTTAALALCVFLAVPVFGMTSQGIGRYLKSYLEPFWLMLPFNLIGELSRTLALAVRLFGNMMSAGKVAAILLAVTPLLFPVIMNLFGLLTGLVQAYIFAILATVYIASAVNVTSDQVARREELTETI
jgi:F-type H+-transporting ATPase subunit a